MIKLIIWLLGLAIIGLSLATAFKPELARNLSERLTETGFAFAAWARVLIGLFVLLIADGRSLYMLLNVLGVLLVLAGAYMMFIGFERSKALAIRIAHGNETFVRLMAVVGVLVGILLLSAN